MDDILGDSDEFDFDDMEKELNNMPRQQPPVENNKDEESKEEDDGSRKIQKVGYFDEKKKKTEDGKTYFEIDDGKLIINGEIG